MGKKKSAGTMSDAEFRKLVLSELEDMKKAHRKEMTLLRLVYRTVLDDQYGDLPWKDAPEPKMKQTERVYQFLVKNGDSSLLNAIDRTYVWLKGGYAKRGLYDFCKRCEVETYAELQRTANESE